MRRLLSIISCRVMLTSFWILSSRKSCRFRKFVVCCSKPLACLRSAGGCAFAEQRCGACLRGGDILCGYKFFSMYPQVNGKKSNFFVPICINPNDSYHFLKTLFSSTMLIFILIQFSSCEILKALFNNSPPIPLCLYAGSTHKLFNSHSLLSCNNKE